MERKTSQKLTLFPPTPRIFSCLFLSHPFTLSFFVHQAKAIIQDQEAIDHEYLPIAGLPDFTTASPKLIFGSNSIALSENRCVGSVLQHFGANHLEIDDSLTCCFRPKSISSSNYLWYRCQSSCWSLP